jgi:hypothetical protein
LRLLIRRVVGRADAAAAGLCPPPETQSGQIASGVVIAASGGGLPRRRGRRFSPLADRSGGPAGLVAVVEPTDLAEGEVEAVAVSIGPVAQRL